MAKSNDLFATLRKRGLRKSAARAIADAERGGKKSAARTQAKAREVLADLNKAGDTIRSRVLGGGTRSKAAKKGAATRKRNVAKRRTAAKRAAATRKARARGH
jgi:hypothetical protein